ncbi:MAG: hypothetical protein A2W00_09195 [Candidatus Eisenbacteria bacterium RBG_16_71_46]|nr:MAG: hypothetical protein A2W00_09195 [Candidatus Eisenbacteria bacterium RBG_16_71_46]OGF21982.1 MAG: hypothetical protein A2V63_01445 [Candidatus Eisenbacteria bacterium RBG_19FT_COMBO_70_11]
MAHLHVPDGVLPPWLWVSALAVAVLLLVATGFANRAVTRKRIAFQSALGALVLVAMSLEVPLGPFEYHLSLIGPVGVLLGAVAGFEVMFVVVAILALMGHGGLTVVGLNALVLGAGTAVARPIYRMLARRVPPAPALASATAASQAVAGVLWMLVMAAALHLRPGFPGAPAGVAHLGVLAAVALPLWVLGLVIESAVAFGVARFLVRVRPDLLPGAEPVAVAKGVT